MKPVGPWITKATARVTILARVLPQPIRNPYARATPVSVSGVV